MLDREKVIKEFEHLLNAAKGNYQDFVDLTVDGGDEILAVLKEQEAAYQGAEELLRQKTMLFDDAIKRLKEQDAEILQLRFALDIAKGTCKGIRVEGR